MEEATVRESRGQEVSGKALIYRFPILCILLLGSEKESVFECMCGEWLVASA